jgi:hypothetical protein
MNRIKVWPHMTIVAVVVALLAGLGVAWYLKNERTASAEELPDAARIQRVEGEVAFNDGLYTDANAQNQGNSEANTQWIAATANQPFSVGDRIYTRDNSRASLAFSGRNFARLDPNTGLDVIALNDGRTQVALREGSAVFDVGYLDDNDLFEVATPQGAVDFVQPGLYNVGFDNDGNVLVSVLSGLAQVAGLAGSGQISKGEMLTLAGQTAADVVLSRLDGRRAGYLVDDYYRYQYPNMYDGRYANYDAYLSDPYYYDPYRRNSSYQYVSYLVPGVNDLDYYGDWQNVDRYGYAWRPRVDAGWAPYQQGYWINDYPYGLTWVSSEPWGYAPYHYGRWANIGNQWYWIPERVNTRPVYSPALVAFIPLNDVNDIGWVPLGPGDPYVARYYDANWQPHYLSRADLAPTRLFNLGIPGAVTVVPLNAFGRAIDPRIIRRIDPAVLANVRPTLEPLLLTPLRNAALNSAWGRGKIDLPPGIAKKLHERPVFVGAQPPAPAFRKDLAKALRVEALPDKVKKEKFKVREEGKADVRVDAGRKQEVRDVDNQAARGNKEVRQSEQPQRQQEKAQRKAVQQPQGEPVGNPARPKAERAQPPQHTVKPQSQGAQKQANQGPAARPGGQSQAKGKAKGKGKP